METRVLTGRDLEAVLDDVARLRIAVFRDWPYLYDGSFDYERNYVESYRNSASAVVVGAFDGDRLVGAATGTPLADHAAEFAEAFSGTQIAIKDVFYCAESVLLSEYRGHGIGHQFFDHREAHATDLGCQKICFCGVQRPADHPMRPVSYAPLDPFWRKRGYEPIEGAIAHFSWKDVDQTQETKKPLQFWIKGL